MDTIWIDIVEKNGNDWRIIGLCPETETCSGALHVYRGSNATVRDAATDAVLTTGRSMADALQKLSDLFGLPVSVDDEVAQRPYARFEPRETSS